MRPLPIVGPSYSLRVTKAECRRSINLFPVLIESGFGKNGARWYLQQVDGMSSLVELENIRMMAVARKMLFVASNSALLRVSVSGAVTELGTLGSSFGRMGWAEGNNQLVMVDGPRGYVLDLDSLELKRITSSAWLGSETVTWVDGRFVFIRPDTGQFYYSEIDDATDLDALDFATAESSPDNLVGQIIHHGDIRLMGEKSAEPWYNAGAQDFTFVRNDGGIIETGLVAPHAICKLNGVVFWLGRDEVGSPAVFSSTAYAPVRISQYPIEQSLSRASDFSDAVLFAYQKEGFAFVIVQVPGLGTTWVYELGSQQWHERVELVDGEYQRWRGMFHAYAYGRHYIASEDEILELDASKNTNGGDILCRDLISPHFSIPTEEPVEFGSVQILLNTGIGKPDGSAGSVMMRMSNDGGDEFGSWLAASAGVVGARQTRLKWTRCGSSRDRVWHFRCTDDIPFNPVSAVVE